MNLILLFPEDFIPGTSTVVLAGRRYAHVRDVHRACPGDSLLVGLENGKAGQGKILRMGRKELAMEVVLSVDPPAKIPVILAVALMRPPVFKRVMQTAVSMGVEAVHVFHSRRVEKSFWQSSALEADEVRQQLVLGLEQARDTVMPPVFFHKKFRPFIEDTVKPLLQGRLGIVADPSGGGFNFPVTGSLLCIGPEGGFIPDEIKAFQEAGCRAASLGPRVLRVETAVTAFLSRLS